MKTMLDEMLDRRERITLYWKRFANWMLVAEILIIAIMMARA